MHLDDEQNFEFHQPHLSSLNYHVCIKKTRKKTIMHNIYN